MNKKEKEELIKKIVSVEETIKVLKLQETNLLDAIRLHPREHPSQQTWVREIILGCDYIVRLEKSLGMLKEMLEPRRKGGGKKKDK